MSVIEDALRRAEQDDAGPAVPVGPPAGRVEQNQAASAAGQWAHQADAWVASARRWRPSAATVLLVVLTIFTGVRLYQWGVPAGGPRPSQTASNVAVDPASAPSAATVMPATKATIETADRVPEVMSLTGTVARPDLPTTAAESAPRDESSAKLNALEQRTARPAGPADTTRNGLAGAEITEERTAPSADEASPPPQTSAARRSITDRYRLDAVMLSGVSKLAVVNSSIVKVGQKIDGATVTAITTKGVIIELDGRKYRIPLRVTTVPTTKQ